MLKLKILISNFIFDKLKVFIFGENWFKNIEHWLCILINFNVFCSALIGSQYHLELNTEYYDFENIIFCLNLYFIFQTVFEVY